jgi:hypothetical protein
MAWIKTEIKLPQAYSSIDAREIGEAILDFIIDRTKNGKGSGGKPFPAYSKEYKDSLEFEIAGKDASVRDLTLSGEMLDSLKVLSYQRGKVVLGFEEGDPNNEKAEGNILGTYGQDTPNPKKARNFMEISESEVKRVLADFPVNERVQNTQIARESRRLALEIVEDFEFDINEGE